MQSFPAVDPIPLPAPIWLLKLLHIVTLALHFVAVEMLLGGLLLALLLSLFRSSPASMVTARALARRLTVVMTFVINLAVPPLLFAQVLYGRALYTSSVLIGLYWIAIIGLLMLTYWLLYRFTARLEAGKSAWWVGLSAWLLAGSIARLLSTNMTLMLRPEVWRKMYSASAMGAYLPTGDPTLTPRWLLMITGGLFIGGLWLVYLAGRSTFTAEEKQFLAGLGGKVAAVFGLVYLAAGVWASSVQPAVVKSMLVTPPAGYEFYKYFGFAGYGWLALVVVAVLLAARRRIRQNHSALDEHRGRSSRRAHRDHARRLSRRHPRPDTAEQGLQRLGSRRRNQLVGRGPLPGPLCRRTGRDRLAHLRSGAIQKSDGGRGITPAKKPL